MQIQGIPLGKDSHRIQDVPGPVNGGNSALYSQWHTQAKDGNTMGIEADLKNQVVKEQSLPETTSERKNGDVRLIYGIFS